MYANGHGVECDTAEATRLLERAAAKGDEHASGIALAQLHAQLAE